MTRISPRRAIRGRKLPVLDEKGGALLE